MMLALAGSVYLSTLPDLRGSSLPNNDPTWRTELMCLLNDLERIFQLNETSFLLFL